MVRPLNKSAGVHRTGWPPHDAFPPRLTSDQAASSVRPKEWLAQSPEGVAPFFSIAPSRQPQTRMISTL